MPKTPVTNLNTLVANSIEDIVTSNVNVVNAQQAVIDSQQAVVDAQNEVLNAKQEVLNAQVKVDLAEGFSIDASDYAEAASTSAELADTKMSLAALSAIEASEYANNSATSALEASGYATVAESHANDSLGYANLSADYRNTAKEYRDDSLQYLAATREVYDNFDDRYLGALPSAPATDNDGKALQEGALYWDMVKKGMNVYTGSVWNAVAAASGALLTSNNLADIPNKPLARSNLGVYGVNEVDTALGVRDTAIAENETLINNHIGSDGSDHSFINQDVTTTGTPKFSSIQLNGGVGTQGTMSWNSDEETVDIVTNGSVTQVGQEFLVNVRNGTSSTIPNGTPVMYSGTIGNSSRIVVKPMDATVRGNITKFIGITTEELLAGQDGKVTVNGKVRGINTTGALVGETWNQGSVLYLSPTVGGRLTNQPPSLQDVNTPVAIVVNAHTSGSLYVRALPIDYHIDADKVEVMPSGNILENNVQGALEDLDGEIAKLKQIRSDSSEPNGFVRDNTSLMGVVEYYDGTVLHRIDEDSTYTALTGETTWFDGTTPLVTNAWALSPKSSDIRLYADGKPYTVSSTLVTTPHSTISGVKYCYFDGDLGLVSGNNFDERFFEDKTIVSIVYWNALNSTPVVIADERHGMHMDGTTHRYLHFVEGTRWEKGFAPVGFVAGSTEYVKVEAGTAYDEDIIMNVSAQTTAPFIYNDGTQWVETSNDLRYAYLDTDAVWVNRGVLTELVGAEIGITFFVLTNDKQNPIKKFLAQSVYNNLNEAREDALRALEELSLAGLPAPEFLPLFAVFYNKNGVIQTLSDGREFVDYRGLRKSAISGTTATATSLSGLLDTDLTGVTTDSVLRYNGEDWVVDNNIKAKSNMVDGLRSDVDSLIVDQEW